MMAQFEDLWIRAVDIWVAGGWGMAAIAFNAMVTFGLAVHIALNLLGKGFGVRERVWRGWIAAPASGKGKVGSLIRGAMEAGDYKATASYFEGLRTTESAPFVRDLRVLKVTIGTAPLLGLFGTVTGMLATFGALATGSGGDQTMEQIAKGISEALITTETGLIVALPGLFVHYQLARSHERYKAFLARLETACNQAQYKKSTRRKAA
ncbi:MAG: Biopolymer transport protein ExbB [Planctomycetota bacterium]|jgi:biopolymer transport protein ExbB